MPRVTRSWLPSGEFHVTVRGNRRQAIFHTTRDAQKLLELVDSVSALWDLKAYCLMPNHVHYVVAASIENLTKAMRQINGPYAQWFNRKYGVGGHLFQGRFDSKPIADEAHLYEAICYVLLNPVRAGLCDHPAEWPWCKWSEQNEYVKGLVEEALRAVRRAAPGIRGQSPTSTRYARREGTVPDFDSLRQA